MVNKFEETTKKVKEILNAVEHITITSDMWTSSAKTQSYLALTGHFVSNWSMQSVMLDCVRFYGAHTAENLKDEILKVCKKHGIEEKIHAIVTDNAANMKAAVNQLGWEHMPCLAHTLNLVVREALGSIDAIRSKTKAIVAHFHRSTSAADKFEEMQQKMALPQAPPADEPASADVVIIGDDPSPNLKPKTYGLVMDVETRWNSTFHMFDRIVKLQDVLVSTIAILQQKTPSLQCLEAQEFEVLKELLIILKPFELLTVELSAESNVTGSKVMILL